MAQTFRHRDILQGKNSQGKFSDGFISLFSCLKSESLLLFKLNQLMVPIGKKASPGDHESSLKFFFRNVSLQDVPVPNFSLWLGVVVKTFSSKYETFSIIWSNRVTFNDWIVWNVVQCKIYIQCIVHTLLLNRRMNTQFVILCTINLVSFTFFSLSSQKRGGREMKRKASTKNKDCISFLKKLIFFASRRNDSPYFDNCVCNIPPYTD